MQPISVPVRVSANRWHLHPCVLLATILAMSGCGSSLVIERQPLTGPVVLANASGTFEVHATVANLGKSKSQPAVLEIVAQTGLYTPLPDTEACGQLVSAGYQPTRRCDVPALDPNDRKSFVLPVRQGLCDKSHCCRGVVNVVLLDSSEEEIEGKDTNILVKFGGKGDLSDVEILTPGDSGYYPLPADGSSMPCGD